MIRHELLEEEGILIVGPEGPLTAADFEDLAAIVDPYIERRGRLRGLMIEAGHFPGWQNFAALLTHLRFVRDHHRKIDRVAAVTDSGFLAILPAIADHFVAAEVKHFDSKDRDAALLWLNRAGR